MAQTPPRIVKCLHCHTDSTFLGAKAFQHGSSGLEPIVDPFFTRTTRLEVYACPKCDFVQLFRPKTAHVQVDGEWRWTEAEADAVEALPKVEDNLP